MSSVGSIRHYYRCQRAILWKPRLQQRPRPSTASLFDIPNQLQARLFLSSSGGQSASHSHSNNTSKNNASHFYNHKALRRVRLKGELRPLLSLAIQEFLKEKQRQSLDSTTTSSSNKATKKQPDVSPAVELLAQWNGYERIDPSRIVVTRYFSQAGRLPLGQGLVAEANPFASENYIVFARPRQPKTTTNIKGKQIKEEHPPFVEQDASWYRHLESRVNDNLNHWEDLARKRRQYQLDNAKQGLHRMVDSIQEPVAKTFEAVTIRLGPIVEKARTAVKHNMRMITKQAHDNMQVSEPTTASSEEIGSSVGNNNITTIDNTTTSEEVQLIVQEDVWNETEPEDLIILTKDGNSLILLNDVHPCDRLLSLPVALDTTGRAGRKSKPYQVRLARGGLVITATFIVLGALAPAYRSLRFISNHPSTAKVVMVTLVGSMAYSAWSFLNYSKTRQRELIAAAIQSRLVARDDAALAFLKIGAVDRLTEVIMEEYISQLFETEGTHHHSTNNMDPVVKEIGCSVGLFKDPMQSRLRKGQRMQKETEDDNGTGTVPIFVVEWEEAREALVHVLAKRR